MSRLTFSPSTPALLLFGAVLLLTCMGVAQNYTAPSQPVIGSGNTVTANAPVPRPSTTPCTVQLFTNLDFADFNPKSFSYTPPADCPGPWAAVVLESDWSVDAGRQFDRTAEIWVGGTNVYFGTTAEPSHTVMRSWHTESNLTEYSPLFTTPQGGRVDCGNLVNDQYTSHIHGSAALQFYPLAQGQTPPQTADVVLPMAADSTGGTVTLNTPSDQLTKTFTLPTNVERVYLDVFAQSQSGDEFWYTCAPNDVAGELENCGSTAFREGEVSIDGQAAGVAPIYPWIYTGGIDPYLWRPIPGVHTLNFEPYRVDLTPFAAALDDGQQHTVALNVYNANGYFSATATLLLFLDAGSTQVTGALTQNTVGEPFLITNEHIVDTGTISYGPLSVNVSRGILVEGYVDTSHGRVDTQVSQSIDFGNAQKYYVVLDGSVYDQVIQQGTNIASTTTTQDSANTVTNNKQYFWPLNLSYAFTAHPDGSYQQYATAQQTFEKNELVTLNGTAIYNSTFSDVVTPRDLLMVDASGTSSSQLQANSETYQYSNSNGACWNQTVKAAAGVLTSVQGGSCQHKISVK